MVALPMEPNLRSVRRSHPAWLLLRGIGALAIACAGIGFAEKTFGHAIALAGYSDDASPRRVVIGSNIITVPANMIRQERARRDGVAGRLDLYLRWPQLDGFSEAAKADFNSVSGSRKIVFLSFEPKIMSRDMSGRFDPIYRSLIVEPGRPEPSGITLYDFTQKSGYVGESLAVARPAEGEPFVARCLSGPAAGDALAPCERDIQLSDELSLTYRFPRDLLPDWQALDGAIRQKAKDFLATSG